MKVPHGTKAYRLFKPVGSGFEIALPQVHDAGAVVCRHQAEGVIDFLGDPDPSLAFRDCVAELSQLGEGPREPGQRQHGGKAEISEAFAEEVAAESRHVVSEALDSPRVVAERVVCLAEGKTLGAAVDTASYGQVATLYPIICALQARVLVRLLAADRPVAPPAAPEWMPIDEALAQYKLPRRSFVRSAPPQVLRKLSRKNLVVNVPNLEKWLRAQTVRPA
jgi:hypothetical protein